MTLIIMISPEESDEEQERRRLQELSKMYPDKVRVSLSKSQGSVLPKVWDKEYSGV